MVHGVLRGAVDDGKQTEANKKSERQYLRQYLGIAAVNIN